MLFAFIATVVIGSLLLHLLFSNPKKDFWKKRGVFEVDVSSVAKPYEVLLGWKNLLQGDDYAYQTMGQEHKFCGAIYSGQPMMVVKDLDLVKKILIKDFDHFVDHRNFFDKADGSIRFTLPSLKGEEWRSVRGMIRPAFTSGKLRGMMDIFNTVSLEWVREFTRKATASSTGYVKIQAVGAVQQYTVDVIASSVFGMNAGTIKNPNCDFSQHAYRLTDFKLPQVLKFGLRIRFPSLVRFLGLHVFDMESLTYFENILEQRLKERAKEGVKRNDFFQLLVEAKKGELKAAGMDPDEINDFHANYKNTSGKKMLLTDEMMNAQSVSFFFAGLSTITSFITLTIYALALYPKVQERLRAEIKTIMKEDGQLDYDEVMSLQYLEMVGCETLRRFSGRVERLCVQEYKDPETGFAVPKDTLIAIPVHSIHHDERYYDSPYDFDPEHFRPETKAKRNPYAFMPFGTGPRNCIGMRFALIEGKSAIAHIVHNFKIEATEKTPTPLQAKPIALGYVPPDDLELKLTPIRRQ